MQTIPTNRFIQFFASVVIAPVVLLLLAGCGGKDDTPYVGFKVRNHSPYPIFANWSLVDPDSGAPVQGGGPGGSVVIPSMWNYTDPNNGNKSQYSWFVWPATLETNYTTKLTIGKGVASIDMYLTAEKISSNFDKCAFYEKAGNHSQAAACRNVSDIEYQYQVAFPYVQMPFKQNFTFAYTSAGSSLAGQQLGQNTTAQCGAGKCQGLGLGGLDNNSTNKTQMNYQNNIFTLMPLLSVQDGDSKSYVAHNTGNNDHAAVPVYTYEEFGDPVICGGPDGDKVCTMNIKSFLPEDQWKNTVATCIKGQCSFAPPHQEDPKCDSTSCNGQPDLCRLVNNPSQTGTVIKCDAPKGKCIPGKSCGAYEYCGLTNNGEKQTCNSLCTLFTSTCKDTVFDETTGNARTNLDYSASCAGVPLWKWLLCNSASGDGCLKQIDPKCTIDQNWHVLSSDCNTRLPGACPSSLPAGVTCFSSENRYQCGVKPPPPPPHPDDNWYYKFPDCTTKIQGKCGTNGAGEEGDTCFDSAHQAQCQSKLDGWYYYLYPNCSIAILGECPSQYNATQCFPLSKQQQCLDLKRDDYHWNIHNCTQLTGKCKSGQGVTCFTVADGGADKCKSASDADRHVMITDCADALPGKCPPDSQKPGNQTCWYLGQGGDGSIATCQASNSTYWHVFKKDCQSKKNGLCPDSADPDCFDEYNHGDATAKCQAAHDADEHVMITDCKTNIPGKCPGNTDTQAGNVTCWYGGERSKCFGRLQEYWHVFSKDCNDKKQGPCPAGYNSTSNACFDEYNDGDATAKCNADHLAHRHVMIGNCSKFIDGPCPPGTNNTKGNVTCWYEGSKESQAKCTAASATYWHVFSQDCNTKHSGPCPAGYNSTSNACFDEYNDGDATAKCNADHAAHMHVMIGDCSKLIPGKCPGNTDTQAGNITCWYNGSKDAEDKCTAAKKTWWHVFSKDCSKTLPGPCPADNTDLSNLCFDDYNDGNATKRCQADHLAHRHVMIGNCSTFIDGPCPPGTNNTKGNVTCWYDGSPDSQAKCTAASKTYWHVFSKDCNDKKQGPCPADNTDSSNLCFDDYNDGNATKRCQADHLAHRHVMIGNCSKFIDGPCPPGTNNTKGNVTCWYDGSPDSQAKCTAASKTYWHVFSKDCSKTLPGPCPADNTNSSNLCFDDYNDGNATKRCQADHAAHRHVMISDCSTFIDGPCPPGTNNTAGNVTCWYGGSAESQKKCTAASATYWHVFSKDCNTTVAGPCPAGYNSTSNACFDDYNQGDATARCQADHAAHRHVMISDCSKFIDGPCPGITGNQTGNITCWYNGSKDAHDKCTKAKEHYWHTIFPHCDTKVPGYCPTGAKDCYDGNPTGQAKCTARKAKYYHVYLHNCYQNFTGNCTQAGVANGTCFDESSKGNALESCLSNSMADRHVMINDCNTFINGTCPGNTGNQTGNITCWYGGSNSTVQQCKKTYDGESYYSVLNQCNKTHGKCPAHHPKVQTCFEDVGQCKNALKSYFYTLSTNCTEHIFGQCSDWKKTSGVQCYDGGTHCHKDDNWHVWDDDCSKQIPGTCAQDKTPHTGAACYDSGHAYNCKKTSGGGDNDTFQVVMGASGCTSCKKAKCDPQTSPDTCLKSGDQYKCYDHRAPGSDAAVAACKP